MTDSTTKELKDDRSHPTYLRACDVRVDNASYRLDQSRNRNGAWNDHSNFKNVRYCECMYATRRTTTSENHLNARYSEDKKERSKNNNLGPLTLHVQLCAYNRPYE